MASQAQSPPPAGAKPAAPQPQQSQSAVGTILNSRAWKTTEPFVLGGLSGIIATTCIQPIDMVKVRIQLAGEGAKGGGVSPFTVAKNIIAQDGFLALYTGISAAWLRQATYTTARMGIFRAISDYLEKNPDGTKRQTSFAEKTFAGLAAGGLGSIIGTPADVALIRMQADNTLPPDQRRNYTGVTNALVRILKEEGVRGMFSGTLPVVVRAMSLNVGMLATHDQALDSLKQYGFSPTTSNIGAKVISGFFASAMSLPFDFVKTRIQKQKKLPDGTYPYKNMLHCATRVIAEEGPGAFYRGFTTYYVRIAPHAMLTLASLDMLKAGVKKLQQA